MSCDGDSCFGYVEIKDGKVVCYTGKSNDPTVHSFCNDEIVQAVKLQRIIKERFEAERAEYNKSSSSDRIKERSMLIATTLQGMITASEYKE